jgi:hypothetical protein
MDDLLHNDAVDELSTYSVCVDKKELDRLRTPLQCSLPLSIHCGRRVGMRATKSPSLSTGRGQEGAITRIYPPPKIVGNV